MACAVPTTRLLAAFIKSQGLGSGERSLAQPECVALNDAWGDGRCVCERKFNRCFTVSVERSASVSSEARARAPASCQHPLERRKRLRRARARRYTRHLAITLPWMCVQVAVSSCEFATARNLLQCTHAHQHSPRCLHWLLAGGS